MATRIEIIEHQSIKSNDLSALILETTSQSIATYIATMKLSFLQRLDSVFHLRALCPWQDWLATGQCQHVTPKTEVSFL